MKNTTDNDLFSIKTRRFQIKKSDLIKNLGAFKKTVGEKKVSAMDYKLWEGARFSKDTITRQFGSWVEACDSVGLIPKKIHHYTVEELLIHLEIVWRWRGQAVSILDLKAYNDEFGITITHDAYVRRWGNWKRFIMNFSEYKLGLQTLKDVEKLVKDHRNKNKRLNISPRLRAKILERDDYTCVDCGASPESDKSVKLEVHHLTPVSKGGGNELENLVTNCSKCNRGKSNIIAGNTDANDFIQNIVQRGESDVAEWKATSRYSLRTQEHDKELHYPIIKAICAIANSKGGLVVVGYDETTSSYVGINKDGFGTDTDKWENWIRQKLDHHTKQEAIWIKGIKFSYQIIEDAVCVKVQVSKQKDPVVCTGIGKTSARTFTYVRAGAYTRTLENPKDIIEYWKNR